MFERLARPFDRQRAPLLRCALVMIEPEEHFLGIAIDHIVSDAWSLQLLRTDLVRLYVGYREAAIDAPPASSPTPECDYLDFAEWQRRYLAQNGAAELAWWAREVGDAPPFFPDVVNDGKGPLVSEATLGPEIRDAVHGVARALGATVSCALLAAYAAVAAHGRDDVVIAASNACRSAATRDVIGFFANMLLVRVELAPTLSFADLVRATQRRYLSALDHQHVPIEVLWSDLGLKQGQVLFNYIPRVAALGGRLSVAGLTFEDVQPPRVAAKKVYANLDLVVVDGDDGLQMTLTVTDDLFDGVGCAELLERVRAFIARAALDPAQSLEVLLASGGVSSA